MNISQHAKTFTGVIKGATRSAMTYRSEHDRASSSWDDYEASRAQNDAERRAANPAIILPARRGRAKSRISGLGEFIRAERVAMHPLTASEMAKAEATRAAKRKFQKDQSAKAYAENLRPYVRPIDNNRYFPHQSTREMARRVRQMAVTP